MSSASPADALLLGEDELLGEGRAPIPPGAADRPADLVLLDRDGTLNVRRPGYVADPGDLRMLPGAAAAVRRLNDAGARVVLVTNQRGLATGRLTRAELVAVHRRLLARLAAAGAHLDAVHVCPHEEGTCDCRKPRPGMVLRALARAPWASPSRCLLVGDRTSDLQAAAAAGVPARQVGPGTRRGLSSVVTELTGNLSGHGA